MKFYGELLIFILLLVINLRVFFAKHAKLDSLVILSPVCVLLSFLQILAWGADLFTVFSLLLSILVFLSNFHAFFRVHSRLYVDHYSPLMKAWAFFTDFLALAGIAGVIFFAPVSLNSQRLGITETQERYSGSFSYGFEPSRSFDFSSAVVTEFSLVPEIPSRTDVVIFLPDKRGDTACYKPYLQLLAKAGYTVCSADFFAKDLKWLHTIGDSRYTRRSLLVISSLLNSRRFMSQEEFYTYNTSLECSALVQLLDKKYGQDCRYFFITDVMTGVAAGDFARKNPAKVSGIFRLDSLDGSVYAAQGYGVIQLTDPLLAAVMGLEKASPAALEPLLHATISRINEAWNITAENDAGL